MELTCYIAITLAAGGIAALANWGSDRFEHNPGPLYTLNLLSSLVFFAMTLLLVAAAIMAAFGVEVPAGNGAV